MKKLCVSIFTMLFSVVVYCQDLPEVIPPSPEASSLMKFVEAPVNHYTGLPSINIPIHTVEEDGLNIPISLSYHAKGITVPEIASRVGIGWALNAGGAISRQIRGEIDSGFVPHDGLLNSVTTSESDRNTLWYNQLYYPNQFPLVPDLYSFNFAGFSGTFIIDYKTGNVVQQKHSDLEIRSVIGGGFTVTDKSGNIYHFGKIGSRTAYSYDQTIGGQSGSIAKGIINYNSQSGDIHTNTWHLVQVDTYLGGKIDFFYDNPLNGNPHYHRRTKDFMVYVPAPITANVPWADIYPKTRFTRTISNEKQLSEIHYSKGKILFTPENSFRQDLSGGRALDKIEIQDLHGNKIKEFDLIHSYTTNNSTANIHRSYIGLIDDATKSRLFLDKVQQVKDNEELPGYEFTYNDILLPNRFSNSVDAWGYFNNKNNGDFLINIGETDRKVDQTFLEAGILKQIKYPTGGMLDLEYEANKVQKPSFYDKVLTGSVNTTLPKLHITEKSTCTYDNGYFSEIINLDPARDPNLPVKISANCRDHANDPNPGCDFRIIVYYNGTDTGPIEGAGVIEIGVPISSNRITIIAIPLNGIDPFSRFQDFGVFTSYEVQRDGDGSFEGNIVYGPGNRIKKTTLTSPEGDVITKEYSYTEGASSSSTSGKVFGFPAFNPPFKKQLTQNQSSISNNDIAPLAFLKDGVFYSPILHGNTTGIGMSSLFGTGIGYSLVTEYIGDSTNRLGKKVYHFSNPSNSGGEYWKFPIHLPTDNGWLRGKLRTLHTYGADEQGNYVLRKTIRNIYSFAEEELDFTQLSAEKPYSDPSLIPEITPIPYSPTLPLSEDTPERFRHVSNRRYSRIPFISFTPVIDHYGRYDISETHYTMYHYTGGTLDLKESIAEEYLDNGNIITTTNYGYDYDNHYQLANTEIKNSQGETLLTNNEYNVLINPFRVLPTNSKSYQNSLKLSEQNTIYKDFNGLYLPEKVQMSKNTQSLEDRVVYHSYDDKGNSLEVSKKDGTKIYYVWGYKKTQPIAQIENYTDTQLAGVQSKINAAITASNNDSDASTEDALRRALGAIRDDTNMENSQITTFTYDALIGVTSITDSRGETIYYQYDEFNRLEFVKDAQGYVLSKNEYNYKN